ncbi:hypothetical protein D0C36_08905 [Mucilaginibacter conchicola]|uniref:Hemerythrin-like domain-containing protein n=1 Tax=Mucilaginibacter conchicola TaxID=2303333 RepID=A0A372NZQ8_9SPHI|nr:hemerythrin domain-containing protein [Mucilaginibacter conchicola]RFZ95618.1 hypothetical protein D0C36_08905 [Mucilaginibacter conchicola]
MKTLRFNVFNQIHKALRLFMFDTVTLMQQTDMTDAEASLPVIEQANALLDVFDSHAYYEDTYILACAQQHDEALIASFENEHHIDLELTENLRAGIALYNLAKSPAERFEAGNKLYYALNEFVAFNLSHMNKEELQLNELLWSKFTDEEIMGMEHNITQNIPMEKMGLYSKWMIKGINNIELSNWLSAVKAGAPDFVYNGLIEECRNYLPAERFEMIGQLQAV